MATLECVNEQTGQSQVQDCIEGKLEAFAFAIDGSDNLEIDGVLYNGDIYEEAEIKEDCIKVINNKRKSADLVSIDAILTQDIDLIIDALESGVTTKVLGVTRIVGYYSRVQNWNISKRSELRDRRAGNYWEQKRNNSEKVRLLGE